MRKYVSITTMVILLIFYNNLSPSETLKNENPLNHKELPKAARNNDVKTIERLLKAKQKNI